MAFSDRYAINYQVATALETLKTEIHLCTHRAANMRKIKAEVSVVQGVAPERIGEAIALLAAANNFDCKAYAILLDPKQGKVCADQLMATAREHLKRCNCCDRAKWARKRLELAYEWYLTARALTAELEAEIHAGLMKTAWVV